MVDRTPATRQSIPEFPADAPPAEWEHQHAGPHGYTRTLRNRNKVIWLPGGKPVPRLASHNYINYKPIAGEFYFY